MHRLILASASPRRKQLMEGLDLPFSVDSLSHVKEDYPANTPPQEIPEYLSRLKSHSFHRPLEDGEILITADTIVVCNDKVLGKPWNFESACTMLREMSGLSHYVYTGVCLRSAKEERSFTACSKVQFRKLEEDEIRYYVSHYKPFDKAGAYGIQEWIGYIGITGIEGSFYNVMGLPVQRLYQVLLEMAPEMLKKPEL